MHQALYRKWRPQTFDDVCGQEHITSILKYETEHQAWSHAYLFCGSRGTGKTTCAKILAKVVNCEHPVNGSPCGECAACRSIENGTATDVLEMDAASNNGVDNIRDIRDEVVYAPSALRYRVYIIDEVHMLSGSAFNALLKTLEEPPAHVIFILATTEMQKLPATIISRCQRFDFRRIATPVLRDRLKYIAGQENIPLEDDAATLLAKLAQGGMRDAISLLELCAGAREPITTRLVNETVGLAGRDEVLSTVAAIASRDYDALYGRIARIAESSMDIGVFWQDLISVYRDMMIVRTTPSFKTYLDLTDNEERRLQEVSRKFTRETILFHQQLLAAAYQTMQSSGALKRVTAELTLTRMCDESLNTGSEALLSRIARLEEKISSGMWQSAPEPLRQDIGSDENHPANGKDGESAETSAPTVPPATAAATAPSTPDSPAPSGQAKPAGTAPATDKKILRPIRAWSEVIERVRQQNVGLASFLHQSVAYETPDGGIVIRFGNPFSLDLAGKDETRAALRGALSVCLEREVRDASIRMELIPKATDACTMEEIIQELNE